MSNISGRRVGELQRGVFKILLDQAEGLPAKEIISQMEQVVPPTEFEKSDYPKHPGTRRFGKMIRFATIATVKAGWLVKEKGRWYLTDEGKNAYNLYKDPDDLRREAGRLFAQWADKQPKEATDSSEEFQEEIGTTESVADAATTLEEAEETARTQIEEYMASIKPFDLQNLVAALLRAMRYKVSWISPPGPDQGLDILAYNDALGSSGPRIKVQVKRRADKINVDGLRAFVGILGEHDVGIFVSTGGFTSDAEREARNSKETRRLTLIDLKKLVELWIEHYDEVSESDKQLLPLRPIYYLAPTN
jgi:restriction system protein